MRHESSLTDPWRNWITAARPRTLFLALASVSMGIFLGIVAGHFDLIVAILTLITALLLQILSNLANDYGDSIHGADHRERAGPSRAVQSGAISARTMRLAIFGVAALSAVSGSILLWLALEGEGLVIAFAFLLLGAAAIWAAISYTSGRSPYGYAGLGDAAVFFFFGWVGVTGSYYLQTRNFQPAVLLPATACGLLVVAVLNVNNIRDIRSDELAGKNSIPVRLGLRRARIYHWCLLVGGALAGILYVAISFYSLWQLLFTITFPLLAQNGLAVSRKEPEQLDPFLRQLSLSTLLFVMAFGIGQVLGL